MKERRKEGREERREEGRKEGKERGREEGRKGGREGEREEGRKGGMLRQPCSSKKTFPGHQVAFQLKSP